MKDKKNLQEKELGNVSGGARADIDDITCRNCGEIFSRYSQKSKAVGKCNKDTVYLCPKCGKWIDRDGKVYEK